MRRGPSCVMRLRQHPVTVFACWLLALSSAWPATAAASPCVPTRLLPQLSINPLADSVLPVVDTWQVTLDGVPISDAQLAAWADDPALRAETHKELRWRATWVYVGVLAAAAGAALSSAGWMLYGRNELAPAVTLPLAIGGLGLGIGGVLWVYDSIKQPLEPHLAPTPRHRLSRAQARELVYQVNRRWFRRACGGLDVDHELELRLDAARAP